VCLAVSLYSALQAVVLKTENDYESDAIPTRGRVIYCRTELLGIGCTVRVAQSLPPFIVKTTKLHGICYHHP
jgi:hypothetical protein